MLLLDSEKQKPRQFPLKTLQFVMIIYYSSSQHSMTTVTYLAVNKTARR